MEKLFTKIAGGSEACGRVLMIILIVLGFLYMGVQLFNTFKDTSMRNIIMMHQPIL